MNIFEFEEKLQAAADVFIEKSREATVEWAGTVKELCRQAEAADVPDHLAGASIQMAVNKIEKAAEDLEKEL